jgi:hypothetical protein
VRHNRRLYPKPHHIKRRHCRSTGFRSIYRNLWADDYGSNDAPNQSIDSTILIFFYSLTTSAYIGTRSACIGTSQAYIGTSCDDRNVSKYDVYSVTRSPTSNTANGLTITLPCTTPNIVSKFPILVQFLPSFVFYSFNYTVKSGGVCNRLPALCRSKIAAWKVPIQPQRHPIYCLQIDITCRSLFPFQSNTPYFLHLLHVYIPLDFHRFTIKLLVQYPHTAKLT